MNSNTYSSTTFYRPGLDALRFCAFMLVFLHHIIPREPDAYANHFGAMASEMLASVGNACGFGLPLFFFLSSYLIATLLVKEHTRSGKIHIASFYMRRILRIWPLYFFALGIGLLYAIVSGHPEQTYMLRYYAVFLGNFYFWENGWISNPATPLWSISIEEQFYILFPFFLLVFGTIHLRMVGCLAIAISSIALWILGGAGSQIDTTIWTNSLTQMMFFGAGVVCATFEDRNQDFSALIRIVLAVMGSIVFLVAAYFTEAKKIGPATSGFSPLLGFLLVSVGCVILFYAFLTAQNLNRNIIFLGKISYGLYVFHELNLIAFKVFGQYAIVLRPLAIFPTILMAVGSYYLLERPFLRLKERFTFVKSRDDTASS